MKHEDLDIALIRQRVKEISELQQKEQYEHATRIGRAVRTENKATLFPEPEIPRQQGIVFLYGMPEAMLRKWFPNGEPPEDINLRNLKEGRYEKPRKITVNSKLHK